MEVAISGSHGLIGTALIAALAERGDTVRRIVRSNAGPGEIAWDIEAQTIDATALEGIDAVVHLAGESIGEKRWSDAQKRRILESRTKGTTLLARALGQLDRKPAVLVSASGVGYYGDRGEEVLTEESPPGEGFTAEVCRQWEASTQPAADAGIRVAMTRSGVVLSKEGGAFTRLLTPFRLGVGGRMGSGRQWMSWITIHDEVGALLHLIDTDIAGPVNLTAPSPVRNAELSKTLGRVLRRPALVPIPKLGPSLIFGRELVEELLFWSQRVMPARLEASGYRFREPDLEHALRSVLA